MTQAQRIGIWAMIAAIALMLVLGVSAAYAATTDYASSVVDFSQGLRKDGSAVPAARSDPNAALGAPDGSFVSLGFGGSITLEFPNYVGTNLSVTSYEITNGTYPLETADVEVSADGSSWTSIGQADNGSGAGPNPHTTTFELPRGTCIKYVRITDTTDPTDFEATADAFDVDAVGATYDETCTPPTPPPTNNSCDCSVTVTNNSSAFVWNTTISRSHTGGNVAKGSYGGSGGSGGDVVASTGSHGGDVMFIESVDDQQPTDGSGGSAVVTNGTGGNGGNGGSSVGRGEGANSANGGYIATGNSYSTSNTINVINLNRTRVAR